MDDPVSRAVQKAADRGMFGTVDPFAPEDSPQARAVREAVQREDDEHRRQYGPPVCLCPVSEAPGQPRTHRVGCPYYV
jgi:hypothetical protein